MQQYNSSTTAPIPQSLSSTAVPTPAPDAPPPPPIVPAKIYYDKSIQTSAPLHSSSSASPYDDDEAEIQDGPNGRSGGAVRESAVEMRARILAELAIEAQSLSPSSATNMAGTTTDSAAEASGDKGGLASSGEQGGRMEGTALATVLASEPYLHFVAHSSKLVQRALTITASSLSAAARGLGEGEYDFMKDYTINLDASTSSSDDEGGNGRGKGRERCRLVGSWSDSQWGKGRSVTDVDWSYKVK